MSEPTDEDLVRRFQRGDARAFDVFVRRHSDAVFRLGLLWLRDGDDANDLVQEVFLRSHQGLSRFGFRAQPKTWIYRVTRNVSREMNRRRAASVRLAVALESAPDTENGYGNHEALPEVRARVRRAVSDLPQRQREVVGLRLFQELSVEDTARVMSCRPGTVKALLHQATTALRRKLDEAEK